MKKDKKQSDFNLLQGKATFTDEPLWYRLIIMLAMAVFILVIIWLLREWSILPSVSNKIIEKIGSFFKGRAP